MKQYHAQKVRDSEKGSFGEQSTDFEAEH